MSQVFSSLYCVTVGKEIVFAKPYKLKLTVKEMLVNISVGISFMIANIVSMLIFGISRIIVDNILEITTSGKISFSLTLLSFFLIFVEQIGMVLFPLLRQKFNEQIHNIYLLIREALVSLLLGILLLYGSMQYVLVHGCHDIRKA